MPRNHTTDDHQAYTAWDAALDGLHTVPLAHLLRDGVVRVALPPLRRGEHPGETPNEGAGAVARWIALHDQARSLRAALRSGDGVGARQVQRAIRSLFLYEHQLTPTTRRQARTVLWQRDGDARLPPFVERARWTRCRCVQCQPHHQRVLALDAVRLANALARSA